MLTFLFVHQFQDAGAKQGTAVGWRVWSGGAMGSLGFWWPDAPVAGPGGGGNAMQVLGNRVQGQGFVVQTARRMSWEGWGWHWKLGRDGSPADEAVPSPGKAPDPQGARGSSVLTEILWAH